MESLSASDLLAGSDLVHEIKVPGHLLASKLSNERSHLKLRPLTVKDLQLISRAAKESDSMTSVLMIQTALVEPAMEIAEVYRLSAGMMDFLLAEVNRISGIGASEATLQGAAEEPLLKAAFILASEFGWTPEQVSDLTLGQLMLNLQLLKEKASAG